MWSWVGHRITGVVIFLFLLVHRVETALVPVWPQADAPVLGTFKNWYMALGESGLVAAVIYHAFNGIRIVLVDFWKKGTKYHKQMLWAVMILWVVVFGAFFVRHMMLVLGG
ncbi:MAG: succinate dehydrogenase, cytochrome b556 subunit [Yaniella sp.]|nr:succinate dehydrogenase, cytochrome b556 subunit [Yaniella sp.]